MADGPEDRMEKMASIMAKMSMKKNQLCLSFSNAEAYSSVAGRPLGYQINDNGLYMCVNEDISCVCIVSAIIYSILFNDYLESLAKAWRGGGGRRRGGGGTAALSNEDGTDIAPDHARHAALKRRPVRRQRIWLAASMLTGQVATLGINDIVHTRTAP